MFLTIKSKIDVETELEGIKNELKRQANDLDLLSFDDCKYDKCRDLFGQIQYYIDDKELLDKLYEILEKKKIEKYPELLKPTYYPEIDLLDISDSEKIRLDKTARQNIRYYMSENNINNLNYPLSINDLELLKSIGVVEKKYNFKCNNCGSSCTIISESKLKKYKRFWKLFELEKQKQITNKQLDELNQLEKNGFYEIYLCCIDNDGCDEIEITNEKELSDYMNNVEVFYSVVKNPDLTYEKL